MPKMLKTERKTMRCAVILGGRLALGAFSLSVMGCEGDKEAPKGAPTSSNAAASARPTAAPAGTAATAAATATTAAAPASAMPAASAGGACSLVGSFSGTAPPGPYPVSG